MHKFKSVLKYMHSMNFNLRASYSVPLIFGCFYTLRCKNNNLLGSIDLVFLGLFGVFCLFGGFLLVSFFLVSVVKASFAAG